VCVNEIGELKPSDGLPTPRICDTGPNDSTDFPCTWILRPSSVSALLATPAYGDLLIF